MAKIDGIEYLTENQWNKKYRAILKRQREKGKELEWYIDRKHKTSAIFYREEQTRPFNQKEMKQVKKAAKILRDTRRARLSCKCCGEYFGKYAKWKLDGGYCEFCGDRHTAWQWLRYGHRIPKEGEEPHGCVPSFFDPEERSYVEVENGRVWYYYDADQTEPVDDKKYLELKQMYIEKFGGWDRIDLDHTTYNGRKWW